MMYITLICLPVFQPGNFDRPVLNFNIPGLTIQFKESGTHSLIIGGANRLKPDKQGLTRGDLYGGLFTRFHPVKEIPGRNHIYITILSEHDQIILCYFRIKLIGQIGGIWQVGSKFLLKVPEIMLQIQCRQTFTGTLTERHLTLENNTLKLMRKTSLWLTELAHKIGNYRFGE